MATDCHCHALPRDWPELAQRYGDPRWPSIEHVDACSARIMIGGELFREVSDQLWNVERRLRDMDAGEVERQVLSTVPVMFSYWAKPAHAAELCRYLNEHLAETVRTHPDRFAAFGTVPLADADLAIEELERCVLELGMRGVEIGTNVAGADLDDPRFLPFFERAAELHAAVFVHPWQVIGADRLKRDYYALYSIAMAAETAFAGGALLLGGVLSAVPELRVLFAHGGGALPFISGRIDRGWEVWPPARIAAPERPSLQLERCWFDSLTWDARTLELLVERYGADHVVLGTDYPFLMGEDSPGATLRASRLEAADRETVLDGSWRELLALEGSRHGG